MTHRNDLVPSDAVEITPSDTSSGNYCGLYVGTGGDVTITTAKGNEVTFVDVVGGSMFPIRFVRVMDTGTTATDLVGFIA